MRSRPSPGSARTGCSLSNARLAIPIRPLQPCYCMLVAQNTGLALEITKFSWPAYLPPMGPARFAPIGALLAKLVR